MNIISKNAGGVIQTSDNNFTEAMFIEDTTQIHYIMKKATNEEIRDFYGADRITK